MTDHQHWDELAAGYALHGLTPEEETEFVTHLETCQQCAASLADHELVAAQLGTISHFQDSESAPSWESMRDAIIGEPAEPQEDAGDAGDTEVADLDAHRRRYAVSRRVLAAAAAVVVLVGGGIAIWRVSSGGSTSCSASAGCHQIQLDATSGQTLASAVVRNDSITVTPTNMPNAPSGKVYVLWQRQHSGLATPISEFTAGTGITSTATLQAPYATTSAFAVSLEKATGTPPTVPSDVLALGTTS
jgi:anti-sigma-K factor RskA